MRIPLEALMSELGDSIQLVPTISPCQRRAPLQSETQQTQTWADSVLCAPALHQRPFSAADIKCMRRIRPCSATISSGLWNVVTCVIDVIASGTNRREQPKQPHRRFQKWALLTTTTTPNSSCNLTHTTSRAYTLANSQGLGQRPEKTTHQCQ